MPTRIISEYIDEFLDCLKSKNGVYNSIDKKEKDFCSKLAYDFSNATKTDTSSDVFSFYLLSRLNEFIYDSIKKNDSFYVDEDNSKLSLSYYELLKDEFDSHNTENNFDDIKWIKNILIYIDNQSLMFQYVNDVAFKKSIEMITRAQQNIYHSENVAQIAKRTAEGALKKTKKLKKEIKEAIDSIDNIIPHMLTSLGIFVSIIIAVIVVYLSDLIPIRGVVPSYITQFQFARYLMSGHIIFNIVFLMLYLISRLTNKTVLLRCSEYIPLVKYEKFKYRPCANCKKQSCGECNFIKKLWKKATYMVGINLICFAGYLFLYDWWIVEKYLWETLNDVINNGGYLLTTPFIRGSTYLVLVNLLFFGLYLFIRQKYKRKLSNKSKKRSN